MRTAPQGTVTALPAPRTRRIAGLLLVTGLLGGLGLVAGCGKKGIAPELQVLKDAGRNVSAFSDTDATALRAKRCQAGTIDGVQALLCEYGSSDEAAQGLQAAQAWVSEAPTGLALQREILVLGLADRSNADPTGKAIDAITKVFRRTGRK